MVVYVLICLTFLFFFFNDTATTEIYTLSLHDALPISTLPRRTSAITWRACARQDSCGSVPRARDRKSTRLNSSHGYISYAVFCLKKKKKNNSQRQPRIQIQRGQCPTSTN